MVFTFVRQLYLDYKQERHRWQDNPQHNPKQAPRQLSLADNCAAAVSSSLFSQHVVTKDQEEFHTFFSTITYFGQ